MHRTASKLPPTEPAQVFLAIAGLPCQARQSPVIGELGDHAFPEHVQTIVVLHWLRKAQHIPVNQIDPMLNQRGFGHAAAFANQPFYRRVQGLRVETRHYGRSDIGNGPLLRRLLVTGPAELPVDAAQRLECVQRMRRHETGETRRANAPPAVDEHLPFSAETRQKIRGGLFRAHDSRRRGRFHDPDMNQLILVQRGRDGKLFDPRTRLDIRGLNAANARPARMHCKVR